MAPKYETMADFVYEIELAMKPVQEAENAKPFIWDTYLQRCHEFYEEMKELL